MQMYRIYQQNDAKEIERLIESQATCMLITQDEELRCGIFNPVYHEGKFYLHLHRADKQLAAMRKAGHAKLVFQDILAMIPSYWVDEKDGSFATTYYRYAEFDCKSDIVEDTQELRLILNQLMQKFQPEGGFEALNPDSVLYRDTFALIAAVVLVPVKTTTKWKLGQYQTPEKRQQIIGQLRQRGLRRDAEAADEVERSLKANPEKSNSLLASNDDS